MLLERAIVLLQRDLDDPGSVPIEDLNQAQELGIEALKFRQRLEQPRPPLPYQLLPGQTRDE